MIYNEQLMRPKSLSFILKPFISEFRDAEEVKETIYVGMVSVAFSDGIFHPLEKKHYKSYLLFLISIIRG